MPQPAEVSAVADGAATAPDAGAAPTGGRKRAATRVDDELAPVTVARRDEEDSDAAAASRRSQEADDAPATAPGTAPALATSGAGADDAVLVTETDLDNMQGGGADAAPSGVVDVSTRLGSKGRDAKVHVTMRTTLLKGLLAAASTFFAANVQLTVEVNADGTQGKVKVAQLAKANTVFVLIARPSTVKLQLPGGVLRATLTPHIQALKTLLDKAATTTGSNVEMYMYSDGDDTRLHCKVPGTTAGTTYSCSIPQTTPEDSRFLPSIDYDIGLELPAREVKRFLDACKEVVRVRLCCTEQDPNKTGAGIFAHFEFVGEHGAQHSYVVDMNPNSLGGDGSEGTAYMSDAAVVLREAHADERGDVATTPEMLQSLHILYDQSFSGIELRNCFAACGMTHTVMLSLHTAEADETPICVQCSEGPDHRTAVFISPRIPDEEAA